MDDLLRCKICHELYDTGSRKPLILPCGHSLCEYCLRIIFKANQVKCPFDKKLHNFRERLEIGVNHQLFEYLVGMAEERDDAVRCEQHKGQFLRFFCRAERRALCQLCLREGHLEEGHQIKALKDTAHCPRIRQRLSDFRKKSEVAVQRSKEKRMEIEQGLSEYSAGLCEMKENLMGLLESNFEKAVKEVKEGEYREKKLCEEALQELTRVQQETTLSRAALEEYKEKENQQLLRGLSNKIETLKGTLGLFSGFESPKKRSGVEKHALLLSKDQKLTYLKSQQPLYDHGSQKMLRFLMDKRLVKNDLVAAIFASVNRRNYVRPEDQAIVFEDAFKSLKFVPSAVVTASVLQELVPFAREGAKVLELGCGTGYLSACLASLVGKRGRVKAWDTLDSLINLARKLTSEHNNDLIDRIEFEVKDLKSLNLEDSFFDIIVISSVLQSFPMEFEAALAPRGVMWAPVGSAYAKNLGFYLFEKDVKGEVRSRKVEVPEPSSILTLT